MKTSRTALRGSRQTGLSLVELMVSVAIALVLMIALAQLLLGTMQTDRTTSNVARIQESGRNALELMGRVIRQAGARANVDVAFSGVALAGSNGTNAPDSITVQYEAQAGGETDCSGTAVAAGALMSYAFAVNTAPNPPTLTCNGVAMVDNIEDMQITFGLDANRDGMIDGAYVDASAADFARVAAVQVKLTVRGPTANVAIPASGASGADGYLRQTFRSTFTVRNQAG